MDIKNIVTNMVILGVLIFSMMAFIIIIQSDAGIDQESRILNNSVINESFGNLNLSLDKQSSSQSALDALEDVPPQDYVGDLDVSATVAATRTAKSIVIGLWNIYVKLPIVILGVSPIVASAITSILLIFIAIAIWAVWKGAISL